MDCHVKEKKLKNSWLGRNKEELHLWFQIQRRDAWRTQNSHDDEWRKKDDQH